MFDTHCHLNFKAFDKDLSSVVRRFQEKGGEYLIVVGTKIDSSLKALTIAKKYPGCFASAGIHPHHINSASSIGEARTELLKFALEKEVVAIGETGLDYYQYKGSSPGTPQQQRKNQKELFLLHLKLAKDLKLPLIIHCRQARLPSPGGEATGGQAYPDLLKIISEFMKKNRINGVCHCFQGSKADLKLLLSLGFFIGFDGNITYKENEKSRMIVEATPLERILLETDSPFLAPVPFRNLRNEPSHIEIIAQEIAKIKKKTKEEILRRTTQNARRLFKIVLK